MKTFSLSAVTLLSLATLTACSGDSKTSTAPNGQATPDTSLQGKASAALDSTKASLEKVKQDYKKTLDAKLAEAQPSIQKLKDEASKATGDAKKNLDQVVKNIEEKQKLVSDKLASWKQSGGESWTALTAELDRIATEIKTTAQDALAIAKKKE